MRASLLSVAIIAWAGTSSPALSESASKSKNRDPNEVVCEKVEVIGSRLAVKRVCGTRAEWAEKRKQDRELVDQVQRAANGPCSSVSTHSGAPAC